MPNDISDVNGICIANLSGESNITRAHVHYEQPQPVYIDWAYAEPIRYQEGSLQLTAEAINDATIALSGGEITYSSVWDGGGYSCQIYAPTPSSPQPIMSTQELLAMKKEELDKIAKEIRIGKLKEEFDAFTFVLEEKLSEYERRLGLI